MAPRRGGGGGSSSSSSGGGSSVENRCSTTGAFDTWYDKAYLAELGVFLLAYLILAWLAWRKAKLLKSQNAQKIVKWWNWGLALFFVIVFYILIIIAYALHSCYVIGMGDYYDLVIAYVVLGNVSSVALLITITLVLVPKLLEHAGHQKSVLFTSVLMALTGAFTLLTVADVIISCILFASYSSYSFSANISPHLVDGFSSTKNLFGLFATILAAVGLIIAFLKLRRSSMELRQGLTGPTITLAIVAVISSLYTVITNFVFNVADVYTSYVSNYVVTVIGDLLSLIVFICIYLIAYAPAWIHPSDPFNTLDGATMKAEHGQTGFVEAHPMPPPAYANNGYAAVPQGQPTFGAPQQQHQMADYGNQFQPAAMQTAYNGAGWNQPQGGYQPVQQQVRNV